MNEITLEENEADYKYPQEEYMPVWFAKPMSFIRFDFNFAEPVIIENRIIDCIATEKRLK